jgi:hypothetical protein
LIQVNGGWSCEQRHALRGLTRGYQMPRRSKVARPPGRRANCPSGGSSGAVGLFREAICLQDIADLTAGAGDLESYSTGTTMHDAISECASNIQKSAVVLNSASGKAGRFLMPELV